MKYDNIIIHLIHKAKRFTTLPLSIFLFPSILNSLKMKTILFWFHAFAVRVFMKQLSAFYSPFKANKLYKKEQFIV